MSASSLAISPSPMRTATNERPRSGSDVPIHLYSFSFNLNPDWTQALADQKEILQCKRDVHHPHPLAAC